MKVNTVEWHSIPLFRGLPQEDIGRIAALAEMRHAHRGQLVFFEGDPCTGFYIVLEGRVKVSKLAPDGKEQILHFFGPLEPVGEAALFEGHAFPANATAVDPAALLFFPRERFIALLEAHPDMAFRLLGLFARRLTHFTRLVERLSLREVPNRLAAYLLEACPAEQDTVELDIPKNQLACLLGTSPETLSRVLHRMETEGVIAVTGHAIRLSGRAALQALAQGETRLA